MEVSTDALLCTHKQSHIWKRCDLVLISNKTGGMITIIETKVKEVMQRLKSRIKNNNNGEGLS